MKGDSTDDALARAWAHLEPWLDGQRGSGPVAVILGGETTGLSFVRSLARRGVPTVLIGSQRLPGTYTRFGHVTMLPAPEHHEDAWVAFLESLGSHLSEPGALFPTSDISTLIVARHEERFRRRFRFVVPSLAATSRITNKRAQYELARNVGIPIPRTDFPGSTEDVVALSSELAFPCLLKPYEAHVARDTFSRASFPSQKVFVADTPSDMVVAYERVTSLGVPVMIQELIPGEDDSLFGYLAFLDHTGRERAWITKRKLRQNPPRYGDGSLQVTVDAPEVAELSRRLLRALEYRGFASVEYKRDSRDGSYRLMEVNPRAISGNQLAIGAGVDFPWIGYRYLTGTYPESTPVVRGRAGVKYVHEWSDFRPS